MLALIEENQAKIIMLGCGWDYCTQFHRYEELKQVPYRHLKDFTGQDDTGADLKAEMFVRDLDIDADNNFDPAVKDLKKAQAISEIEFNGALIEAVSVTDLAEVCSSLLNKDLFAFVHKKEEVKYRVQCQHKKKNGKQVNVSILGNANLSLIEKEISRFLADELPYVSFETYTSEYGQVETDILNMHSALHEFSSDFTFFLNRFEDLTGVLNLDNCNFEKAEAALDNYLSMIKKFRQDNTGTIFVMTFADLIGNSFGAAHKPHGYGQVLETANNRLRTELANLADLHLIEMTDFAIQFHHGKTVDDRLWFVGRFPFSAAFSEFLAKKMSGLIFAASGYSTRLIVLDLDNTLWGGILGDDGVEGLQLGGDYPGNVYLAFQNLLTQYAKRGVALAVCSKMMKIML